MKLSAIAFALLAAPVAAACPQPADISGQMDVLITAVQAAPNETAARPHMDAMWKLWATAPDAKAQEMLDRGMARRETYDYAGALEAFNELVAYCPDYAEGYNQRAFINFLTGDFGTALEDLDLAIARSPRHLAARTGKALTLMGLGRNDVAQAILREALEVNPWLPERAYLIEPPGQDL
ncbi:MAG: hypothetical protein HRU32_13510 [Rhodobacteraceae bacterium]|nr:hypothetical protein [Paracoccaceae bacterium]